MRPIIPSYLVLALFVSSAAADEPSPDKHLIIKPSAFMTLVNPACSHCRDEANRRAGDLRADDPVLSWIRGYADGGAIPIRFFLSPHRVISDSYGVFVYDPDAGFARGFAPSYEFRFYGWRNGVMVMRHSDGTLYSCLSGLAFSGPKAGSRLKPVPALVSNWGFWLEHYPHAVAYQMFDKYKAVAEPGEQDPEALRSRLQSDPRLKANERVLGVHFGVTSRAYALAILEKKGLIIDAMEGQTIVLLWEPRTRTAAAYRPVASPPRKYKAPQPDNKGISPSDPGTRLRGDVEASEPRRLTLQLSGKAGPFSDAETRSAWDVTGRCVEGALKGWTLEWVDNVEANWFAWVAEYPRTSLYAADTHIIPFSRR